MANTKLFLASFLVPLFFAPPAYAQADADLPQTSRPIKTPLCRWEKLEPLFTLIGNAIGKSQGYEEFVYTQFGPSLAYLPSSLFSYPLKPRTSAEVKTVKQKAGGFIKGVCHANTNYEQIKAAGIEWNRSDIPFPFDSSGNQREEYTNYKVRLREYAENGIKTLAVTPYPREFIAHGIDPRLPANERRVKEVAIFLAQDLQNLIGALQITNEMGLPRFTLPLSTKEAVHFMGLQLEAIYPVRGDVLIGYNSAGPQVDVHLMMRPYHQYCDYVGIDIYIGCFSSHGNYLWMYDILLAYLWSFTSKPIILCEFGYMSGGAPKMQEEKQAILMRYGVSCEEEARKNINDFVSKLPQKMQDRVRREASGDWGNFLFISDFKDHLYTELSAETVISAYPHTPEGQGAFYQDILPRLLRKPYLLGAFIYNYRDSAQCYVCGQNDCPIETRWGLTTIDGQEKPAYKAVRQAFNSQ